MAVKGIFASDQNIQASRKGDFESALLQVEPTGNSPLLALSSGMETKDASDTVVTWFEENHITGRSQVTNSAGTGTSLVLSDASSFVAGVILMHEASGELVYIESISGSTATVTRAFGGGTIATIAANDYMQRIMNAHEEGSARPTAVANLGFPRFNYCGTFRNAWDVTGTAKAIDYHTGDLVAKNKRDAAMFHAEDIERGMIWSKKSIGTLNGRPFRTMDGITTQIVTHKQAQGANVSWDIFDLFLQGIFEKNIKGKPNERIAFCGNGVISVLQKIMRLNSTMNIEADQTDFGLRFNRWITPYGNLSLMTHPLFTENPTFTQNLLVLHPGAVRTRWLRRTSEDNYDKDGTRAGVDADFGVITSEMCVEYRAEATGGYFTGINTAAA